jgi:hypothetical protein
VSICGCAQQSVCWHFSTPVSPLAPLAPSLMCNPSIGSMLVKVWSEMCEVVESAVSHYEHQVRLSQQFHAKFRRLSSHTETKLAKLTQDNQVGLQHPCMGPVCVCTCVCEPVCVCTCV